MPLQLQLTNRGCVAVESFDDVLQERTVLGYAMYDSRVWTAFAVSPYDWQMFRRVGRNLATCVEAQRLIVACTKPYFANQRRGS